MAEAAQEEGVTRQVSSVLGRPRVDVDLDDVEFLCSLKLSLIKVASLLGVSRSTLYRRILDEGRIMGNYKRHCS